MAKDLFELLLPKFVLDSTNNFFDSKGVTFVNENIGDVTILFCDIADFDEIVRNQEDKIVELLDKIFKRFDDLCNNYGIQKIETVGKTYMAAGGIIQVEQALPQQLRITNPTLRVLHLAKSFMEEIKNYQGLKLKIGIHVGKPVMGVIGFHKPQFSLIGDVVNTTSRHCTTGEKGRIMISEDAFRELGDSSILSNGYSKKVVPTEMKGKGIVNVYHLFPSSSKFRDALLNISEKKLTGNEEIDNQISTMKNLISAINQSKDTKALKFRALVQDLIEVKKKQSHQLNHLYHNVANVFNSGTATSPDFGGMQISMSPHMTPRYKPMIHFDLEANLAPTIKEKAPKDARGSFSSLHGRIERERLNNQAITPRVNSPKGSTPRVPSPGADFIPNPSGGISPRGGKAKKPKFYRTGKDQIEKLASRAPSKQVSRMNSLEEQRHYEHEENELLVAGKALSFKQSEYDLVRKYMLELAANNRNNCIIFMLVLIILYGLEIFLYTYYYSFLSSISFTQSHTSVNVSSSGSTFRFA